MRTRFLFCTVFFPFVELFAQSEVPRSIVVPTVITNHYDQSEAESHGVVTVRHDPEEVSVSVRDLAKGRDYTVLLLDEATGNRVTIGTFTTDARGAATKEFSAKGLLKKHNALLITYEEDVIQYAQLQESHHGCICRHSGGTIVTRRLDQECYECPCGVKYEICCGGKK